MTPRRVDGPATAETMRQLRRAIQIAMRTVTSQQAAALAGCHENTISRILSGRNVSVRMAARIAEALGHQLTISVTEK